MLEYMKAPVKKIPAAAVLCFLLAGCTYQIPYLSLDVKSSYAVSDVVINYSYVCEADEQRCVYSLYNTNNPSVILFQDDSVMPHSGTLTFGGLAEGNYRLFFSVYSTRDGESSPLKFLDSSWDFTVDIP